MGYVNVVGVFIVLIIGFLYLSSVQLGTDWFGGLRRFLGVCLYVANWVCSGVEVGIVR